MQRRMHKRPIKRTKTHLRQPPVLLVKLSNREDDAVLVVRVSWRGGASVEPLGSHEPNEIRYLRACHVRHIRPGPNKKLSLTPLSC